MTTIAFRAGILAGDSCWSYRGSVDTLSTKLTRLRSGALLGHSGDNDGRLFVELLNNVRNFKGLPKYNDLIQIRAGFLGLIIFPCCTIAKIATTPVPPEHWTEDFEDDVGAWEIEGDIAAVGSGGDLAKAAMLAGASARQAVSIACKIDMNSRLPVHTISLLAKQTRGT